MKIETLETAKDLQYRIDMMRKHAQSIREGIQARIVKSLTPHEIRIYAKKGRTDSTELFSDFLPISESDFLKMYLMKVDEAIVTAETELQNL